MLEVSRTAISKQERPRRPTQQPITRFGQRPQMGYKTFGSVTLPTHDHVRDVRTMKPQERIELLVEYRGTGRVTS